MAWAHRVGLSGEWERPSVEETLVQVRGRGSRTHIADREASVGSGAFGQVAVLPACGGDAHVWDGCPGGGGDDAPNSALLCEHDVLCGHGPRVERSSWHELPLPRECPLVSVTGFHEHRGVVAVDPVAALGVGAG